MKKVLLSPVRSFVFVLLCCLCTLAATPARADEFRAVWVDAFGSGFLNSNEVAKLVSDCNSYNFNAVIVQMRRRADAFYMPHAPNGDPRATAIASGYDALAEVIRQCHNATPRIEVHCWAPTHLIWSDTTKAPTQSNHVFNAHPEYLMKSSGGSTLFAEGYYLDPGHPDATLWNYNMAMDIASHYDIDGFHWDYIRYPQQDAGYNATAVARYNAEFGLSGQPAPSNAQFANWRRRQVTDFLRWANADLLAVNPSMMISASVFSSRTDAYNARFQDWAAWANEGLLDVFFPMNYTTNNAVYFIPRLNDACANQGIRWCYMGLGAYMNPKEDTLAQLELVRAKPLRGTSLFSYRTPNSGAVSQAQTFAYIRDHYQPTWEPTPALPWLANPTKGIVKGTVTRGDNGAPIYNASMTLTAGATRTQLTEPHGKFAFFETEPGVATVVATVAGLGSGTNTVTVTAGGILVADIVINVEAADVTPPVLSALAVSGISSTGATVAWATDESSDSKVEYGLTTAYGSSASVGAMTLSHVVALSGLSSGTTYQYRVLSKDAAGNQAVSANGVFTTVTAVADIIIDNPQANVAGTWATASGATDKYGADYRYRSRGTGTQYLQYTPNIPAAGSYQVYAWYPQGSNRPTNAPYVVSYAGGAKTNWVNQTANGGKWNLLGAFNFAAGMAGNVRITDGFTETNKSVMADAVKFVFTVPVPPPPAPGNLVATAASSSRINLTWTDYATNETGYRVERSTNGINFAQFISLSANATGTFDSGLAANTTYSYRVRAYNASGNSAYSPEASATTKPLPPAPPAALVATAASSSQIDLAWSLPVYDPDIFIVVARSTMPFGPFADIVTLPAQTTEFSDLGLSAGTTYYYVARALNDGGASTNSNIASATTLPLAPTAPTDFMAVAISPTEINLTWKDNATNETFYLMARRVTDESFSIVATLPANATSFINAGLEPHTQYFYVVSAGNAGGTASSGEICATTMDSLPVAVAGAEQSVPANDSCQATVTLDASASSDPDGDALTYTWSGPFGAASGAVIEATLPAGVHPITLTVDDGFGGTATAGTTVTVADATAPQLALLGEAAVTVECHSAFVDAGATATDACAGDLAADILVSGAVDADSPGIYVLVYSVTDLAGNTAMATRTVTVVDTTAPMLTLLGDAAVTVECHGAFEDPGAIAHDACFGELSSDITVSGAVDANTPGAYTLTYTVADAAGNVATAVRTVTVVDTTAPVLALNGAAAETVECHGAFADAGATASDLCAGDLTSAIAVSGAVDANLPGVYTLIYTVADVAGNVATAIRTVTVVDTLPPALILNGEAAVTVECHSDYVDAGAVATDLCEGDLTAAITVSGSVDVNTPGTYTLTYTVVDAAGNIAMVVRTVEVVDTTAPVIVSAVSSPSVLWPPNHSMIPVTVGVVATDAGGAVNSHIVSVTCNEVVNGQGDGNTSTDWVITGPLTLNLRAERIGSSEGRVYTITIESRDAFGNVSTKAVTVLVPHSKSGK